MLYDMIEGMALKGAFRPPLWAFYHDRAMTAKSLSEEGPRFDSFPLLAQGR